MSQITGNEQAEDQFYLETLRQIISIPTASFHEEGVGQAIMDFLEHYNLPYQVDPYGNIIAHYQNGPACRSLTLMAHTDHPGFELDELNLTEKYEDAQWIGRLLGGVTLEHLQQGSVQVFVGNDRNQPIKGRLVGAELVESPRSVRLFLAFDKADTAELAPGDFGIWDLTDFELNEDFIHARVMDDLVGCVAGLLTLWKLAQEKPETDVYAVFTRAEEVGLVGAELVFQQKLLPSDTYVVSLEASRTLPGAVQGEGPVIRTGDRAFTFSEEAELVLKKAAEQLQPRKVQRQLMSGGRCEASTAILQGYIATGLAFPLANYHNMGSNQRLEPENIHLQDFLTGVRLLQKAAELMPKLAELQAAQRAAEATNQHLIDRLADSRAAYQRD